MKEIELVGCFRVTHFKFIQSTHFTSIKQIFFFGFEAIFYKIIFRKSRLIDRKKKYFYETSK